jgi:transposase
MKMVHTKNGAMRPSSVDGVRVNRTGRRTYTLNYKLDVVRQCCEPGASVAAIAMARGINANLVRRWMVRHQSMLADQTPKPPAMLPVTIDAVTAPAQGRAEHPVEEVSRPRRPGSATIEIEFCGARLYLRGGVDAQALRDVLDALARR